MTTTVAGHQHWCLYGSTSRCARGRAGMPATKKCPACRGPWMVTDGLFGVFTWRGDGRYSLEAAHATYASNLRAEKHAATNVDFVVRFIAT